MSVSYTWRTSADRNVKRKQLTYLYHLAHFFTCCEWWFANSVIYKRSLVLMVCVYRDLTRECPYHSHMLSSWLRKMCNKNSTIRRGSIELEKNGFRLFLRRWSFDHCQNIFGIRFIEYILTIKIQHMLLYLPLLHFFHSSSSTVMSKSGQEPLISRVSALLHFSYETCHKQKIGK